VRPEVSCVVAVALAFHAFHTYGEPPKQVEFIYEGENYENIVEGLPHREAVELAIKVVKSCRLTTRNTPWQIMHGVLLCGPSFEISHVESGKRLNALEYVFDQTTYRNLAVTKPFIVSYGGAPHILRGDPWETEDHDWQYLYICSQARVPLDFPIVTSNGQQYVMNDLLEDSMEEMHPHSMCVWAVPAFAQYIGPRKTWTNKYGQRMNLESLVDVMLHRAEGIAFGTCHGTHLAYALAYALQAHRAAGGRDTRTWNECAEHVRTLLRVAQENQNPDGSFWYQWQEESRPLPDPEEVVDVTGHMLEWISVSATEHGTEAPWIRHAADVTARSILTIIDKQPRYGALAHAARGLDLYLQEVSSASIPEGGRHPYIHSGQEGGR